MRPILKSLLLLFAGAIYVVGGLRAAPPAESPIPLEKGNRWTYQGKIETTLVNSLAGSPPVFATNICWVMEVMDSMKSPDAQAAVVRGYPDELAWYEPGRAPGYCILLNFSNRIYQLTASDEKQAGSMLQAVIREPGKFSAQAQDFNELFQLPLTEGKRWGGNLQREDGWYCWRVEKATPVKLQIKGYSKKTAPIVYTLAYRTNPEHELLEIVSGLGITHFIYAHHGTVSTVDVRLVSFKHRR